MIMIMIKIIIMNVEYIWLTSLQAMQINVSFAAAHDFNQLIYAVFAQPLEKTFIPDVYDF